MFASELLASTDSLLERQKSHPFVMAIGDGSLDEERFRRWLLQDYRYLESYARALALAAAHSPDLGSMRHWAEALRLTLVVEMDLHRRFSACFGLSAGDLEIAPLWPTTRAYGDFLRRVAAGGDPARTVASQLPCAWDYYHLARHLESRGLPADPRYAEWIRQYASREFRDLAIWLKEELDRRIAGVPELGRIKVRETFVEARGFELRFWDMCWRGESESHESAAC